MKHKFLKSLALLFLTATSLISTGCEEIINEILSEKDQWAYLVNEKSYDAVVDGSTLTYGSHTYSVSGTLSTDNLNGNYSSPTTWVTFSNIPSGYTEFSAVYNELLGRTVQGTAAMVPMALEIYARNKETGERCLRLLCNSEATVTEMLRVLEERFKYNEYGGAYDSYVQRYIPAASLQGATPNNAYRPDEPYTVAMCPSVNKSQNSSLGTVHNIYILSKGWTTNQRQIQILQPNGGGRYKVFGCTSVYTQCQTIVGTWRGLK